uniref:Uncharacterized protein n=1 Tax=Globodera rostochiensis TaxID=31243 RepID=A0A914HVM1_GLORO
MASSSDNAEDKALWTCVFFDKISQTFFLMDVGHFVRLFSLAGPLSSELFPPIDLTFWWPHISKRRNGRRRLQIPQNPLPDKVIGFERLDIITSTKVSSNFCKAFADFSTIPKAQIFPSKQITTKTHVGKSFGTEFGR